MASRQALRKAWWQVHKWLGLALMILFVPLGLSGVVLAWDDAIDHVINPQRYAVHGAVALPPSAYAASTVAALGPDARISQIRFPKRDEPVVVMAMVAPRKAGGDHAAGGHAAHDHGGRADRKPPQRISLWLDPVSARVLDMQGRDSGLIRVAHNFHGNLLLPGFGRALVGLLGVAMFLMGVGGVWLWWPPVGSWLRGFRWRRGDRKLDTNLHHQIGFWIALPLTAQAFTGVWMSWPQMMAVAGLAPARVGPMERARMLPAIDTHMTADQALAAAQGAQPGTLSMLAWPVGEKAPWRVTLGKGGEIVVDDATGVAEPAPRRDDGGLATVMRHYHDGTTLGTPFRIFLVLLGLAPTLLAITGITMWLRGRRWRSEAARRTRKTREPVAAG